MTTYHGHTVNARMAAVAVYVGQHPLHAISISEAAAATGHGGLLFGYVAVRRAIRADLVRVIPNRAHPSWGGWLAVGATERHSHTNTSHRKASTS